MKKDTLVKSCILCILFLLLAGPSFALGGFTLGVKIWVPTWELKPEGAETLDWDPAPAMYGPTASFILTDRLALSASILYGDFESSRNFDGLTVDYEASRSDLDTVLAFILNPYVNVFGGIKYLRYETENKFYGTTEEMNSFGFGLGVGGNFPIGDTPLAIYGTFSASYLAGTYDISIPNVGDASSDITYPIISFEAGVRYNLDAIPLVFMGSFRYQQSTIENEYEDVYGQNQTYDIDETFWGPVLFVGYRFGT